MSISMSDFLENILKGKKVMDSTIDTTSCRESTVAELFFDENGKLHIKTENGWWCPAVNLSIVDEY